MARRSVRAQLRHPARPVADSHALRYPWSSRGQLIEVQRPRAVARPRPRDEAPPSLRRVLAARVPQLQRYYGALRFPAVLAVPLCCLRETVTTPCACVRRSTQARRRLGARGVRVRPPPEPVVIEAETIGRPKFLGSPHSRLPCSIDAGRTAGTRPVRCRGVAPGMWTAEAPAKGLSALYSRASGLAVYASPPGLPQPTQDSHPAVGQTLLGGLSTRRAPAEGFRVLLYISSFFPRLCLAQSHRPTDPTGRGATGQHPKTAPIATGSASSAPIPEVRCAGARGAGGRHRQPGGGEANPCRVAAFACWRLRRLRGGVRPAGLKAPTP